MCRRSAQALSQEEVMLATLIEVGSFGSVAVITPLEPNLCTQQSLEDLVCATLECCKNGSRKIVINLAKVEFFARSKAEELLALSKMLGRENLCLCRAPDEFRQFLIRTGLVGVFNAKDTLGEALAYLYSLA